jgi:hypothetical protein
VHVTPELFYHILFYFKILLWYDCKENISSVKDDIMKKNDFILIGIIAAIVIIAFVFINYILDNKGEYVEVVVDGVVTKTFSLKDDTTYKIETENGYNILVIKDGEAYIKEASCPDKLCMHQRPIKKASESLICLPNKVVVKVVGDSSDGVDSIVY